MKSYVSPSNKDLKVSHPARGAWIEITVPMRVFACRQGRTPHGVRGLKSEMYPRLLV